MNQPDYLGLSIIELSVFLYNYVKPKYEKKTELFYVDTVSFIV